MKSKWWIVLFGLIVLGLLYYFNCNTCIDCVGHKDGKFQECGTALSCISSQSADPKHHINPITYRASSSPIPRLKEICKTFPKSRVMTATSDYLHVEFRSPRLSWVDDAEFFWNREKGVIEMRAAARCGFYDFKTNRKRLEKIRKEFTHEERSAARQPRYP